VSDKKPEFVVQKAGEVSRAGYVYSDAILKKMAEQINSRSGGLLGQLAPTEPGGRINLREVSHKILPTAKVVDGALVVEVEILDTPQGRTLQDWMVSQRAKAVSRGVGSVGEDGVVGDDYRLTTIDFTT
jgi:hypothetical protein